MRDIADLAQCMRARRESGSHPYVLVLGAGASLSSGTSLNRAAVERVIGTYDVPAFDAYLDSSSDEERFAVLRDLVEGASPSAGYQCLADDRRSRHARQGRQPLSEGEGRFHMVCRASASLWRDRPVHEGAESRAQLHRRR